MIYVVTSNVKLERGGYMPWDRDRKPAPVHSKIVFCSVDPDKAVEFISNTSIIALPSLETKIKSLALGEFTIDTVYGNNSKFYKVELVTYEELRDRLYVSKGDLITDILQICHINGVVNLDRLFIVLACASHSAIIKVAQNLHINVKKNHL